MPFQLYVAGAVPFSPGVCLQICLLLEHDILEDAQPEFLAAVELGANGKLGARLGLQSTINGWWHLGFKVTSL